MAIKGLFINNIKAQDSIYESGLMVFNCLKLSSGYQMDYVEISAQQRTIPLGYDFYFFNYHPFTMDWMDSSQLKKIPGLILTMVLEVSPRDPFVLCPSTHFHGYCVLDPTLTHKNKRVFTFPRPLETIHNLKSYIEKDIPVIGTFGFATKGKGFQHVVEAVNKEFEKAIVRINIPYGDFVPDSQSYSLFLGNLCKKIAKQSIEVIVTHDYMSKAQLVNWCSQNTLNCFLYDRNMPGLSATTDQAIMSGRPIAVSNNDTFRHILAYLPSYPDWSLHQSIQLSTKPVRQMQKDWSQQCFTAKFEVMLQTLLPAHHPKRDQHREFFEIPILKNALPQKIKKFHKKCKGVFTIRKLKQLRPLKRFLKNEEPI